MKIIVITACSNCPYIYIKNAEFECSLINDGKQYNITCEHKSYIREDCPLFENNAINLLQDLVEACRYIIPKSNALNDAYHSAKDFLLHRK